MKGGSAVLRGRDQDEPHALKEECLVHVLSQVIQNVEDPVKELAAFFIKTWQQSNHKAL